MKNLITISLGALLIGAAPVWAADTPPKESVGQVIDDSVITTKIKAAFLTDETLKVNEIKVETYKGVVQLSGFVRQKHDIDRAMEVAKTVVGVKSVKNDLHHKT
ncbi:BON domain-containing protein [Chitinimonas sp. BJB300]|uniref:BON domain-containing protein n=1 Tax=Chitinimonas sp. BJB300 TaxID=1559339 RepID=UPI000C10E2A7|nr:BON domain-containing protein [Chitinimonas sp. BJB300]PHV09802.1 transporter [Chitinimonas sp. BJB300]TSJ90161.1 BON domain-containing protein [Chitinimonas sp. BJB300]